MNTDSEERLRELYDAVRRIERLLDDPQPGLWTWSTFLSDAVGSLCKLWYGRLP